MTENRTMFQFRGIWETLDTALYFLGSLRRRIWERGRAEGRPG